jgi:hypothetical protein
MLDFLIAADLVRQRTRESIAGEVAPEDTRTRDRRHAVAARAASASAEPKRIFKRKWALLGSHQ